MANPPSLLLIRSSSRGGTVSTGAGRVIGEGLRDRPTDRAIGTTRPVRRGRPSFAVLASIVLWSVAVQAPADVIDPVPVGAAIRGSDLLVPLRVVDAEADLPRTIPVRIGEAEVEAPIALLSVSSQTDFKWVAPSRPIDVRSPGGRLASPRDTVALAVVPLPANADGEISIAGTTWTPTWLPALPEWNRQLPIVEPEGADADPPADDPMEWFRWSIRAQLSGRCPPPCRMSSPLEERVARAISDEWRAGLRRVRDHSPSISSTVAERLVATVEDPERAFGERSIAMWPTDARELTGLRTLLLDFSRTDEEVALASLAWFEVRPSFVAWLVDTSGETVRVRLANPTVEEVVVFASFTTSDAPEALILPPRSLTTHAVARPGSALLSMDEQLILDQGAIEVRLDVGPSTIRVEPPGASFGPMVIGRTLASVNGDFVEMPDLPGQTAGILRRRFGRWEVFVEARGLESGNRNGDRIFIQVGPADRPVAVLGVSRDGGWRVESGPDAADLSVTVVDHGDRWRFVAVLPETWLVEAISRSSEGGVRLGLRRDGPEGIVQFAGSPPASWKRRIPTQSFGLSWWDDPVWSPRVDF